MAARKVEKRLGWPTRAQAEEARERHAHEVRVNSILKAEDERFHEAVESFVKCGTPEHSLKEARENPMTDAEVRAGMVERILYGILNPKELTPENVRMLYAKGYEPELRWKAPDSYEHACPVTTDDAIKKVTKKG